MCEREGTSWTLSHRPTILPCLKASSVTKNPSHALHRDTDRLGSRTLYTRSNHPPPSFPGYRFFSFLGEVGVCPAGSSLFLFLSLSLPARTDFPNLPLPPMSDSLLSVRRWLPGFSSWLRVTRPCSCSTESETHKQEIEVCEMMITVAVCALLLTDVLT